MDWLQLSIELPTTEGDIERLEEILQGLGASAISLSNATEVQLFEPAPGETPLWDRSWISGLFPANTDPANVLFSIQAQLGLAEPPRYRVEALADCDWVRLCLADLKPMAFGQRLWICPTGHSVTQAGAVVVHLDPGLAFGTGTHASTALCLRQLDCLDLNGKAVIDYGCGSGILAVAAALLGAHSVVGVDIDPQAILATEDNATRNAVANRVTATLPEAFTSPPVDLLVANILSAPLQALASRFGGWVRPGGNIVLAGLLEADAEVIRTAYAPWFTLPKATLQDGWLCLTGSRH